MDRYTLRFRTPDGRPTPDIDVNPYREDLRFATGLPGGPTTLEVGMAPMFDAPVVGSLATPLIIPPYADVTLYRGMRSIWNGVVVEFSDDDPAMSTGFVAEGYGIGWYMQRDWNRATSATASTSGAVLATILASTAPALRIASGDGWTDPGVVHSLNDFYKMAPGEVVDQITKEGSSVAQIMDFRVVDRTAYLTPREAPLTPDYRIPFERGIVRRRRNYRTAFGAAIVEYGASTGTLTAENQNTAFVDAFGIQVFRLIPGGTLTAAGAAQLRDTQLAEHAGPDVAYTITYTGGRGVRRWDGAAQPFDLVQAGEWLQVADDEPRIIVGTSVDANQQSLTIEVGAPSPHLPKNWNRTERDMAQRARRYIAPTGGRTR